MAGSTFDWTYVATEFTNVSRTSVTVAARLGYYGQLTSGTAWFDDLKIEEISTTAYQHQTGDSNLAETLQGLKNSLQNVKDLLKLYQQGQ